VHLAYKKEKIKWIRHNAPISLNCFSLNRAFIKTYRSP